LVKARDEKCSFVEIVQKQTSYWDESSEENRTVLLPTEKNCENPADGLNGFCRIHTYVVLKPIAKEVEEEVTENIKKGGEIHPITYTKKSRKIFGIGENIPADKFSESEISEYISRGYLGVRTGQNTYEKYDDLKQLTDIEINEMSARPASEIEKSLKTTKIAAESLKKLSLKIEDKELKKLIEEKIREQEVVFKV